MGLLEPTSGKIFIDDKLLSPSVDKSLLVDWRNIVAHVPQSIFLADATIAENIAIGVPKSEIDIERLENACASSQILEMIDSLPLKFDTFVGESGSRLSGGQRQRLAIARALYKQAKILVLDEATSALDSITEQSVAMYISASRDITVVMVSHKSSLCCAIRFQMSLFCHLIGNYKFF